MINKHRVKTVTIKKSIIYKIPTQKTSQILVLFNKKFSFSNYFSPKNYAENKKF